MKEKILIGIFVVVGLVFIVVAIIVAVKGVIDTANVVFFIEPLRAECKGSGGHLVWSVWKNGCTTGGVHQDCSNLTCIRDSEI